MHGKIALEAHFATEDTFEDSRRVFAEGTWPELRDRLTDAQGQRLRLMDEHGIEVMFLSLNAPAVQGIPDRGRPRRSRVVRTTISPPKLPRARVGYRGSRRCRCRTPILQRANCSAASRTLGFNGALVNGFTQVGDADTIAYYDQKEYWPFWARDRASRRTILSASPESADAAHQDVRGTQLAHGTDVGIRAGDRGSHVAADGLGPVRRLSTPERHSRTPGRKDCRS
jgi:hypothetical protein